jgi:molybdopterin-synthase adenylyltransferase
LARSMLRKLGASGTLRATGSIGVDRSRIRPVGQLPAEMPVPTSATSEPSSAPFPMTFSAALTTEVHEQLCDHLLRQDGQEDICFALYRPSQGRVRTTGVVSNVILPLNGDRGVHGNASFSGGYFLRAAEKAAAQSAGLALLHSHPEGKGWQGMSRDDVNAERGYAAQALAMTDLPLLGMTLAGDGHWSARFWERTGRSQFEKRACENVRVVGDQLRVTYDEEQRSMPEFRTELERTISAWGSEKARRIPRPFQG